MLLANLAPLRMMPVSDSSLIVPAEKFGSLGVRPARFAFRNPADDARLNIIAGAVRSSKTWATFPKILRLCRYEVGGQRFLTGVTKQSIYRNVLTDLFDLIGERNYQYNRQSGELLLFGKPWLVIGAKDEGSEKYIRGATVGAAVGDELTLMPRSFFKMLLSRMSPDGARFYGTTNPDSPYHWLRSDVYENKDYTHGLGRDLWWQTWTFRDNPHLSEEYQQFLRRSYTGVWAQRFIEGLWVLAEGAIYRDVLTEDVFYTNDARPIGLLSRGGHVERWITLDYGTTNALAAIDVYDDGVTLWADREYYWDSRKEGRQKTDSEYASALIAWIGGDQRNWPGVIIDPSAASFRAELMSRGMYVVDADNTVADGIRRVSTMLGRKRLRINREGCPNGTREMQSYVWNEKKMAVGGEAPVKSRDHFPDALRYKVQTHVNDWRLAA
jgi:PBSX family phage terminase large subunit